MLEDLKRFIVLVRMPAKMKIIVFPGLSFSWGALAKRVLLRVGARRVLARLGGIDTLGIVDQLQTKVSEAWVVYKKCKQDN